MADDPLAGLIQRLGDLERVVNAALNPSQPLPPNQGGTIPAPPAAQPRVSLILQAIAAVANTGLLARIWRPVGMFAWMATWPVQLIPILKGLTSTDPVIQAGLGTIIALLGVFNAGPAALAVTYSIGRTQEKVAAANAAASVA